MSKRAALDKTSHTRFYTVWVFSESSLLHPRWLRWGTSNYQLRLRGF